MTMTIALDNGQTLHPMDEIGRIFEIKDKEGSRVRIANANIEKAVADNADLRHVRYLVQTFDRIQTCRIACGNGQFQLEQITQNLISRIEFEDETPRPSDVLSETTKTEWRPCKVSELWGLNGTVKIRRRAESEWVATDGEQNTWTICQDKTGVSTYQIDPMLPRLQENVQDRLLKIETHLLTQCKQILTRFPIWTEYLSEIKGIGPRIGGLLIATIVTPERFANPAKLWKYFGLGVTNGKADRRKAGESLGASADAKQCAFKLKESFVKTNGGYRKLYDQFKAREVELNENRDESERLSKGHVDSRARRRVVKIFLAHLLETWRTMEGLETPPPYPISYLGHSTIIRPFTDE